MGRDIFDESLLMAARRGGTEAERHLLELWEEPKNRIVNALARPYQLAVEDIEDARQEAVLWLKEAIDKYEFTPDGAEVEFRLAAFVRCVLATRLANYARQLRRARRRNAVWVASDTARSARSRESSAEDLIDPLDILLRREFDAQIETAVSQLDDRLRDVLQRLCAGEPLGEVARALRISYHQTRRLRGKLLVWMSQTIALGELPGRPSCLPHSRAGASTSTIGSADQADERKCSLDGGRIILERS